jgi:hypothetical protein
VEEIFSNRTIREDELLNQPLGFLNLGGGGGSGKDDCGSALAGPRPSCLRFFVSLPEPARSKNSETDPQQLKSVSDITIY